MQGEDPNTPRLSDAIHWMQVYEELITLKDDLLGTARERMQALPEPAAEEIRGSDLVLLGAERDRFVSRLNFWKRRHMELEDLA
ncbi:MAG: hypothetical protein QOK05_697 [Chloroflexota bacterium]|jgi:hypothetical protein|nr:hypothetical protein [Chloroflexota bacterium]